MENPRIKRNNQIIDTMVAQMGGRKFFVMTGAKPLYKDVNTENPLIALKLTRNASKATHLKVTYNTGSDLYKMEFHRSRKLEFIPVKTFESIYGEQLQEIFTEVTGMYTTL